MTRSDASLNRSMQELQRGVDPEVLADIGYEVPEQYRRPVADLGDAAVAAVQPGIPPDVSAELDAYRAAHPAQERTDDRHISLFNARNHGYFDK